MAATTSLAPQARARQPSVPAHSQPSIALEQIIAPIRIAPGSKLSRFSNWGGTFHAVPERVYQPVTVEQCLALVELARREGAELRPVGRAHSPSDLPFTKGWVMRMEGLEGLLEIDHTGSEGPTVHVLAGTYVSDLHVMLSSAQPPLALSNVGSISEQTIGGLLATATHGTGIRFPVISAYARELTLICPLPASQGGTQLVRCSRAERPELFNASLCGLGSTGLIVSVRLAVEPAFRLRQTAEEVPFEFLFGKPVQQTIDALGGAPSGRVVAGEGAALQFASQHNDSIGHLLARGRRLPRARSRRLPATRIADPARIWPSASGGAVAVQGDAQLDDEETREAQRRLEEVVNSAQHVRCMWFPQVAMCTLLRADRTYEEPIPVPLSARLKHNLIGYHLTQLLIFLSRYHQSLPPRVARTVHYLTHPSFPARANAPPRVGAQVGDGAGMAQVVDASVSQEKESELRLAVEKPELPERPSFIEQGGWTLAQQGYAPEQRRIGASTEDEVSQSAQEKLTGQSIGNGTGIVFPPAPSSSTRVSASSLEPLDPQHPTSITINVSHVVFNMDCLFPQYTDEWGIPFEHSAAALRAMRDWLDEEERNADGVRIHFPVEIRFTDADDIWLSHCQGRRTCFIGVIQFRPYNQPVAYRKLFARFEALMRHFGGRPHWAKAHTCGVSELSALYPHLPDFLRVREEHDPDRLFVNPYIRRHLLGEVGEGVDARVFKSRL